jgi:hypothetical protein
MLYETQFLVALSLSWLIEIPVLLIFVRISGKDRLSWGKIVGTGFIATALTLPYLWFVLPPYLDMGYYPLSGEIIVIALEAVVYMFVLKMRPLPAAAVSLLANAASFAAGLALFR